MIFVTAADPPLGTRYAVTVRATDANGHTADIQVNIRDVAAFQPYLVSAGNGATTVKVRLDGIATAAALAADATVRAWLARVPASGS